MLVSEDREIRAVHATQIAAAALFRIHHVGRVIALGVECGRQCQDLGGTELYAESAGLTALDYDLHGTFGHLLPFLLAALPKGMAAWAADLPFQAWRRTWNYVAV